MLLIPFCINPILTMLSIIYCSTNIQMNKFTWIVFLVPSVYICRSIDDTTQLVYSTQNQKTVHDVCEQNYIFTYGSPKEKLK